MKRVKIDIKRSNNKVTIGWSETSNQLKTTTLPCGSLTEYLSFFLDITRNPVLRTLKIYLMVVKKHITHIISGDWNKDTPILDQIFEESINLSVNLLPEDTRDFHLKLSKTDFDRFNKAIEDKVALFRPKVPTIETKMYQGYNGIKWTVECIENGN